MAKCTFATLTSSGITKELDQLWGKCLMCSGHVKQRIRGLLVWGFFFLWCQVILVLFFYLLHRCFYLCSCFCFPILVFGETMITICIRNSYMPVDMQRVLTQKWFFLTTTQKDIFLSPILPFLCLLCYIGNCLTSGSHRILLSHVQDQ